MKIKQTVQYILGGLTMITGLLVALVSPTFAATCGGVQTSIVTCDQTGASGCKDGTIPFEGTKPAAATTTTSPSGTKTTTDPTSEYKAKYGHDYGKCKDGSVPQPSEGIKASGVWGILLLVLNILVAGVGIAAVAGIVYASILYTSAGGNAEQTKKAMTMITNVVIGVVAFALMYAGLNFLIPGGLFNF